LRSEQTINVCTGKEWYRFPSSFFLPDNQWVT
jgi:alpha-1,2-mannosyltransferase